MENEDRAAKALGNIIRELNSLDERTRSRILNSVLTFFHLNTTSAMSSGSTWSGDYDAPPPTAPKSPLPQFSADNNPSPKDFLMQKQPRTDVERITCLAYYLTHFRDTPYFKTLDLAKLNTEAAQPKFSNTAYTASNATVSGYLVPAPKGQRQISGAGEQFVVALPDHEAARQAIALARRRKNARRKK